MQIKIKKEIPFKCNHCNVAIFCEPLEQFLIIDTDGSWFSRSRKCPNCKKAIISLFKKTNVGNSMVPDLQEHPEVVVRPKNSKRSTVPQAVPKFIANDYNEACLVLNDSPKASAALSRRCLQNILREHSTLDKEIQEVLDRADLPSYLIESLDSIRNIGNFAAHPIKVKNTGEIIDVEQGEAEWNLDVLESLFDVYYVQPVIMQEKKNQLNEKLKSAGKPEMK
jgi:hypothetical protein